MEKKKRLVVLVEPSVKKTFTLKCIEKDTTHQEVLESAVNKFIKQKAVRSV